MPIIVNLDVMMAKRKISLGELAERIDLTLLHSGSYLQRTGLPAGRYSGIQSGRMTLICNKNAPIRDKSSRIDAFKLPFK